MCGISGAVSFQRSESELERLVSGFVAGQMRRGPDHQAQISHTFNQARVVLGHNRLSIIDLSDTAHQPMWDTSNRWCVVYNGEIYNYLELRDELKNLGHEFKTQSDTEIILEAFKAWGVAGIEKFNGMFAFALLDVETQKLFLVRDRFGVKPLFYTQHNNALAFASSAKVLANTFESSANLDYVARGIHYLEYENSGNTSPYENILALPAGHFAEINLQQNISPKIHRYYHLQQKVEQLRAKHDNLSLADAIEQLDALLNSAIGLRLRADVPLAVSLSGGLDSSSIAVLAAKQHPEVVGFCYGQPSDASSEGPIVAELLQHTKLQINYIWPESTPQNIQTAFSETLEAQEAPFPSLSILAQNMVYKTAKNFGIKVLLGGQGGDEAFMGYRKFQLFQLRHLINTKQYILALQFLGSLTSMLLAELPQMGMYWQNRNRYTTNSGSNSNLVLAKSTLDLGLNNSEPWQRQASDVTDHSLPTLLRYEDRNSMYHSIESRLPFLDFRIIEFGLALPEQFKLNDGYGKWIMRQIMKSKIPASIWAAKYKRGFDVKQKWIEAGLGNMLRSTIEDSLPSVQAFLKPNTDIGAVFDNQSLQHSPTALPEAITLVWLASRKFGQLETQ